MILFITISTFVCIMLGALGVYFLMFRPASAATERLKRMSEGGGAAVAPAAPPYAHKEASPVTALPHK